MEISIHRVCQVMVIKVLLAAEVVIWKNPKKTLDRKRKNIQ